MAEYSIYPIIRTDKPIKRNNKYPIYLRVRIYDRETKLPANLDVAADAWNVRRREPKERSLRLALNAKVIALESYLNTCIANGIGISIDSVKEHLSANNQKTRQPKEVSFFDYFISFMERRKSELRSGTLCVYQTTYNVLKAFRPNLRISDINLSFIEEFDAYMTEVNGNANGGKAIRHQNLKTVLLDMIKHDLPVKNPYPLFKIPKAKTKEVYLEKSELESLRKLYYILPQDSTLFKCLEMYLFSCFCGLRISDVISLKWKHIDLERGLIIKEQVKTKAEVKAPLFDCAKEILHRRLPSKDILGSEVCVFDSYCHTIVNDKLNELATMAGINKHLTYHTSRHTFATLLVMDGVSIYKIQKFLGHKSVSMTERYLKYDLKMAQVNMEEIETFS